MSITLIFGLYVFFLATFVGYQIISKVPHLLHTPLMAFTNAISGISLVGSLRAVATAWSPRSSAPSLSRPRPSTSSAASSSPIAC